MPPWSAVGCIKYIGSISTSNTYAATLAIEMETTLILGVDPEFGHLSEVIDLHQSREETV